VSPDGFRATIALLNFDNQHRSKSWLLVRLCTGAPDVAYVWLWKPFERHTQQRQLPQKSYESDVRVTDVIPFPTGHPLWPSQTSTFCVCKKYPTSGNIP
jgi:hypothetical protein